MSTTSWSHHSPDFYKILRISHTATTLDIKKAYRQLAQELHPDKHHGCSIKQKQFQAVNEAYTVLSDYVQRKQYDHQNGYHHYGADASSRIYRAGVSANKMNSSWSSHPLYTARPPPHWKHVWDHQKHYDMHYGDGFRDEAIRQAKKNAMKNGTTLQYESSIGRGFTFDDDHVKRKEYNPYSKRTPQGPPKIIFDYEEISVNITGNGKEHITRRERIVEDMYLRRSMRQEWYGKQKIDEDEEQQQQQQANGSSGSQQQYQRYHQRYASKSITTRSKSTAVQQQQQRRANGASNSNECVIL